MSKNPSHPRDRLKHYNKVKLKGKKDKEEIEIEYLSKNPSHLCDRLKCYNKKKLNEEKICEVKEKPKLEINNNAITKIPFINIGVPLDRTAREQREYSIIDKTIKSLPDDHDKCYIEHDRDLYE